MNLIKIKWIVGCDIELVFLYLQSNFFNMTEVEVDSDFNASKANLRFIVYKFN